VDGEKVKFPWIWTAAIVAVFGLLVAGYYLWPALKIQYYLTQLNSADDKEAAAAVTDLLAMGERGRAAIRKAIEPEEAAELVINYWDKPNAEVEKNRPPLIICAIHGYNKAARLFLAQGADPFQEGEFQFSYPPREYKGKWGGSGCIGGVNFTPLQIAVVKGNKSLVELLIKANHLKESVEGYKNFNRDADLPLEYALLTDHRNLFEVLIKDGARPIMTIRAAINSWREEYIPELIKLGVQIHETDRSYASIVNLYIDKGLNDPAMLELLVKNGANIKKTMHERQTPLHNTVGKSILELAKVLMQNGADVNARDGGGYTPLDCADTDEMKSLLKSYGAKTSEELNRLK
jgi:ankyrin repeat protein